MCLSTVILRYASLFFLVLLGTYMFIKVEDCMTNFCGLSSGFDKGYDV